MKKPHYAWLVLATCCAVIFSAIGVLSNCIGVFMQPMARDLGAGVGEISLYQTMRSLSSMAIMPFIPRIMRRANLRWVVAGGITVACAAFAVMGSFRHMWQFYIAGAASGMAGSLTTNIPLVMIINNWFARHTGAVTGVMLSFTGVGGAIMSPVAEAFITAHGWRAATVMMGTVGFVVAAPLAFIFLRTRPADKGLLPSGAGRAAPGARVTPRGAPPEPPGLMALLRQPAFLMVTVFSLIMTLVSNIHPHMPGIAMDLGFTAAVGAVTSSAVMIGLIVGKVASGGLSDRIGVKWAVTLACSVGMIGVGVIMFSPGRTAMLLTGAALVGVSVALPSIATPLLVNTLFGRDNYPVVTSYISIATSLMGAASVPLFGFIYDGTGSYRLPLLIVAVGLAAGILSLMATMRLHKATLAAGSRRLTHK
jgi:MFS family permease